MPSQEDLDLENKNSLSNQRASRSRRDVSRAMKDKMNSALRNATSTKERREIKEEFRVDTNKASNQTDNQMGVDEDSNQRGDDNFKPDYYEIPSGDSSLAGISIIWADQSESFISAETILQNYNGQNYWSVVFGVSSGGFSKAISFDSTQELWDDVGDDQTVYRLRVKTLDGDNDPTQISAYGQYREDILCVNGEPVVTLINIS